ncbi:MAG: endolytic transglycosylase MltG [Firmicutes bacterium]|nr:endolytic transglycosylase MltG [Bacillota bacterium]
MWLAPLLILLIIALFGYFYGLSLLAPVSADEQPPAIIEIPQNSTSGTVAAVLEEKGLIKNALVFRLYSRYKGWDSKIQTGEYQLAASMSTPEILKTLTSGNQVFYTFTIPEGYTVEQIAQLLEDEGFGKKEKFLQLSREGDDYQYPFLNQQSGTKYLLEGYLFPDTYKVTKQSTEQDIIYMMLERFMQELEKIDFESKAKQMNLNVHQAVTIAAMIEKEALSDKDRPLISGVIQNRLEKGMPLQIDATVLYALGKHKEMVLNKDLEVDSPYNTYQVSSLPPGPIASPGSASLKAAVEPEDSDYLYYVAKPDGSHAFSRTLTEHIRKAVKYQ